MSIAVGNTKFNMWRCSSRSRSRSSRIMLLLGVVFSMSAVVEAIFADEVGKFDFLVATAGHGGRGGVSQASFSTSDNNANDEGVIVTSGSDSCYVSGRNVTDGSLLWRRNSCSSSSSQNDDGNNEMISSATMKNKVVATLDSSGVLRGWTGLAGEFLFDSNVVWMSSSSSTFEPKLIPVPMVGTETSKEAIVVIASNLANGNGDLFSFHSDITGESLLQNNDIPIDVERLLNLAKVRSNIPSSSSSRKGKAQIISISSTENTVAVLIGWVFSAQDGSGDETVTSLSNLAIAEFAFYKNGSVHQIGKSHAIKQNFPSAIISSTIKLTNSDGKLSMIGAIDGDDNKKSMITVFGLGGAYNTSFKLSPLPSDWLNIVSTTVINSPTVSVSGVNQDGSNEVRLFLVSSDTTNVTPIDSFATGGTIITGFHSCNSSTSNDFALTRSAKGLTLSALNNMVPTSTISLENILDTSTHGEISNMYVHCTSTANNVFITTTGGTSAMVNISPSSTSIQSSWVQEESLASITNTVFLDRSSLNAADDDDEENYDISVSHRLALQIESLKSFLTDFSHSKLLELFSSSSNESRYERDFHFGFAKVAVMLSASTGRLFGLDSLKRTDAVGTSSLLWSLLLNPNAIDHKLVHGGVSSSSGVDGGGSNHGTNELLILSTLPDNQLEYKCIDGIHGRVHSSGLISKVLPVSQIIPVRTLTHGKEHSGCKQIAVLLYGDGSVDIVPDNAHSINAVKEVVNSGSRNGFYAHSVDKLTGIFSSYKIVSQENEGPLNAERLGETLFKGEKILKVTYPQRGEVVTSPATILGDDSLLLKFLNPHLVVVVTYGSSEEAEETFDPFESALLSETSGSGKTSRAGENSTPKKKPLGATKPGESAPKPTKTQPPRPNLFINLVDSVSSKILHRVSHSHASDSHPIPVTISENWIIYTYFNTETKRTDVGVLTLHEGMIEKYGITAFHSHVEQEFEFSSFASEKPIVLSKVYTLGQPKAVTALGVTQTSRGISSKHVLFALGSNQILSVDRRWLDPRRPGGEPKQSEKVEGLQR